MRWVGALFSIWLVLSGSVLAQFGAVEVRVVDAGYGVPGASVKLLGNGRGASTEMNGTCVLDSLQPGVDTVQVMSLGYYTLLIPCQMKPDTITRIEASLLIVVLGHSDGGECGTPVHGEPAPADYADTHATILYSPRPR